MLSKVLAVAAIGAAPAIACAGQAYMATLTPLNGSGVSGSAMLNMNDDGTLTVQINATGLEPGQTHVQHIHGFLDGTNSVIPPPSAGGDAASEMGTLLSVAEGAPFYGAILLPLEPSPTPSDGVENYLRTFTDADAASLSLAAVNALGPVLANQIPDLMTLDPLDLREIVLHGMTVNGVYSATLPVASGELVAIPLPAAAWSGLSALLIVGAGMEMRRRKLA